MYVFNSILNEYMMLFDQSKDVFVIQEDLDALASC